MNHEHSRLMSQHNSRSAMEAGGAYNRHAAMQAAGAVSALPFLEAAILEMPLSNGAEPLVIADYGSSQGKNSFSPVSAAIRSLRLRTSDRRPIIVVHVDQPTNDFNELFRALDEEPDSYVRDNTNIFPTAVAKSFYESVFPPNHIDLGWSAYAAHWLSRIPGLIPDHFHPARSTGSVHVAFEQQAAEDWKAFLTQRARELRPGARLVVVIPGLDDDGSTPLLHLFDEANAALAEMVAAGIITADERAHMVLRTYPRRRRELLAPFAQGETFDGLTVRRCELSELVDFGWQDFQRNGDAQAWARKHALFFRTAFTPSLASALHDDRSDLARGTFADDLEARMTLRLARSPSPLHSFVQTIVIAKTV